MCWAVNSLCLRILTWFILNFEHAIKRFLRSFGYFIISYLTSPQPLPMLQRRIVPSLRLPPLNWEGRMVSNSFIKLKLFELLSSNSFSHNSWWIQQKWFISLFRLLVCPILLFHTCPVSIYVSPPNKQYILKIGLINPFKITFHMYGKACL